MQKPPLRGGGGIAQESFKRCAYYSTSRSKKRMNNNNFKWAITVIESPIPHFMGFKKVILNQYTNDLQDALSKITSIPSDTVGQIVEFANGMDINQELSADISSSIEVIITRISGNNQ